MHVHVPQGRDGCMYPYCESCPVIRRMMEEDARIAEELARLGDPYGFLGHWIPAWNENSLDATFTYEW